MLVVSLRANPDAAVDFLDKPRWQFSVRSALALCTCVAVLTSVVAKVPNATWIWWQIIGLSATTGAVVTLLAAWIANGKSILSLRITAAIAFTGAVYCIAKLNDQGFAVRYRMIGDALSSFFSISEGQSKLLGIVTVTTLIGIAVTIRLATSNGSIATRLIFAAWCLLVATPPIAALRVLLQPLPIRRRSRCLGNRRLDCMAARNSYLPSFMRSPDNCFGRFCVRWN